ncbi:hypothetical protein [Pontibacter sp. BAB1700]|nr:hypothetical protein [Pontibacter sp. BAB1700]
MRTWPSNTTGIARLYLNCLSYTFIKLEDSKPEFSSTHQNLVGALPIPYP